MAYTWDKLGLRIPEIMLPKEGADYGKWAVVACDQYTSDPAYWQSAEKIVGNAPSTLRLMLPEFYLGKPDEEERIAAIRSSMESYVEKGTLRTLPKGCVLVRRSAEGRSRLGLVICVDLDAFDYNIGASSLIRSTEKTIVERESTAPLAPATHLIRDALEFIRQNATKNIRVTDVVEHLHVSRSLADLRFREFQGETIRETITRIRLDEVKKRLLSTKIPVGKLARVCGFSNVSHLEVMFRRRFGMSMGRWRTANAR